MSGFIKVLVRVTARDIAAGKKNDCEFCAIGRAVNRRLKHDFVAQVRSNGAIDILWRKGYQPHPHGGRPHPIDVELHRIGGSEKRRNFISYFDSTFDRDKAKPFEFTIDIPETLGWVLSK